MYKNMEGDGLMKVVSIQKIQQKLNYWKSTVAVILLQIQMWWKYIYLKHEKQTIGFINSPGKNDWKDIQPGDITFKNTLEISLGKFSNEEWNILKD